MRIAFLTAKLVLAIAMIAGLLLPALLDTPKAVAQGATDDFITPEPIDISVEMEYILDGYHWLLSVKNDSSDVWVYDVKVRIETRPSFVPKLTHNTTPSARPPIGWSFSDGILTIPAIRPGDDHEFLIRPDSSNTFAGFSVIRITIISSIPIETPGYENNNRVVTWAYIFSGITRLLFSDDTRITVLASVDNLHPPLESATFFKVSAKNPSDKPTGRSRSVHDKVDTQVKITITEGLSFAWANTPDDITISGQSATWYISHLPSASDATRTKTLEVPVKLSGSTPLETRCLTADVQQVTPPDPDGHRHDDLATVCLGDPPIEVLGAWRRSREESIGLFTFFPCIGATAFPCNTNDTLELVVDFPLGLEYPTTKQRRDDAATTPQSDSQGRMYLQPESVVVHVDDPIGRAIRDGTVIWSTGNLMNLTDSQQLLTSSWQIQEAVTVTAPGGGNAPGRWLLTNTDDGHSSYDLLDAPDSTRVDYELFPVTDLGSSPSDYVVDVKIQLWGLGTYVVLFEIKGELSGTTYTDSGTYTFHVGPMADLEVRDAGRNPAVAGNRRAYTIEAVNHGPSNAPAVELALTGVPAGASVVASQGSYDPETGIWSIGELESMELRPSLGKGNTETLTIISEDASPAPITATIENKNIYTVCIDGEGADVAASSESECTGGNTWHAAEYYDPIPGNNTATIAAQLGTGAGDPNAPSSLSIKGTSIGNILLWGAVEELNGYAVTHYEVERWANQWTPLAGARGNLYFDMGRQSNTDYRVRAVNNFGVPGPWSITGRPPNAPGNFTVTLAENGNGAVLSWTEPASPTPVTGYVIDIADSDPGDSRTNDVTLGGNVTTYTHTGLSGGDVKFYRVQARNRDGVGPWTEWQSVSTGPGAPGSLRARANGPSEIVLTWNEASSRDVTIYEYELEYSDTSASEGYEWTFLNTVLHDEGLRYMDNTVPHGTTRYYRVRGRTLQGNVGGAWSNVASATTSAAGPSAPLNVSATEDGENRIQLTWDAPASGDAVRYNINHSTDGSAWESERTGHTGTCSVGGQTMFCYTDSGLLSGTTHYYRVASVNRSGAAGEWSEAVSATTDGEPTEAPGEPQNLRITSVSGRQVTLAWDAPADDGGTRVTGYEYMVEGACALDQTDICQVVKPTRTGGTTRTVTVPNIRGRYEFYVRALNAVGASQWSQPVGQYINPQRTWRVELLPSRLAVKEGSEATYRVKLTSDPGQPVWVALDWSGDPDLGNTLSQQQFKWLLPSNYASRNPDIYLDPNYTAPWNTGVTITLSADEDDGDTENGTALIANTIFYIPCADLGNPAGCVDDPEDTGVTAYLTVTEEDND